MIGLVTPYKTINYGTKLQAYAMQEMLGKYDETELINFVTSSDHRVSAILGKVSPAILGNKLKMKKADKALRADEDFYKKHMQRKKAIASFDKEHYKFSESAKGNNEFNTLVKKYDSVVCGSDQLWAPRNVKADWFTLTIVPDGIKRISFAASFGIEEVPSSMKKKYKKYLDNMDAIAVRETSGARIVKELTGKEVQVTLDPTLMLDATEWEKIANKSTKNPDEPYIMCYFLGDNKMHRDFARKLREKTGCKIYAMGNFKGKNESDVDFADCDIYDATPDDFVNLIRNAAYVCTDSFHGTVFSTIFKRKVAVFERFKKDEAGSTNSRIYSLLDMLGTQNQLITSLDMLDDFSNSEIDYDKVYERLEAKKQESYDYLDKALNKSRR